jgi:NADPH-dependent curcumin reductase
MPVPGDFDIVDAPLPEPGKGDVLLRGIYLSLDPYMRGRISGVRSYAKPTEIGEVIEGRVVGQVAQSKHPGFREGDYAMGGYGWQLYSAVPANGPLKLDPNEAPISTALGILGMPGMTAYTGLTIIGRPRPGETVVVAAAAGAVGSAVGQIAKIKRCRVVGIAGGPEKCRYLLDELGFDAAVDHRSPTLADDLAAACPKGIDIYFENVGGAVWSAVLPLLNDFARVPVCGLIAHYNDTGLAQGPDRMAHLMRSILIKHLTLRGFVVNDFAAHADDFLRDVGTWLTEKRIKYREDVVDGLDKAPEAFIGLLNGRNFGKLLVRVNRADTVE